MVFARYFVVFANNRLQSGTGTSVPLRHVSADHFGGKTFFADQKAEDAATTPEQKESPGFYL